LQQLPVALSPAGYTRTLECRPVPTNERARVKITFYALTPSPPPLRSADARRAWMDTTPDRHAYRCLPLAIANAHGWEVLAPCGFEVTWNGGPLAADLTVRATEEFPWFEHFARSHFADGVVTLHIGYLLRTEPGWHTLATGPFNSAKDGIAPLTGIIETDWLPYTFTMNWRMTRAGTVRFVKGEPVCFVFPLRAHALAKTVAEIRDIADDPELRDEMEGWAARRAEFMARFDAGDPQALREAWQRYYFKGRYPDGVAAEREHSAKLRVATPVDRRSRK
jgi:hypothetical protein